MVQAAVDFFLFLIIMRFTLDSHYHDVIINSIAITQHNKNTKDAF